MRRLTTLATATATLGHIAARFGHAAGRLGHALLAIGRLWHRARTCIVSALLLVVVALVITAAGACTALGWGIARVTAAGATPAGLDVVLVIDQSDSLFELGGVGSDPDQLRMAAARVVAERLGDGGPLPVYRLGVVAFGTHAALHMPLTPLHAPDRRQAAADRLAHATPMGWTDVRAALRAAHDELHHGPRSEPAHQTAVILFTDGRPQTPDTGAPGAEEAYLDDLAAVVHALSGRGTAVFTVLLHNAATDADPRLTAIYRPFWIDLAESGIGVRFYDVRSRADLVPLYAALVADLALGVPSPAPATAPPAHRGAEPPAPASSPPSGTPAPTPPSAAAPARPPTAVAAGQASEHATPGLLGTVASLAVRTVAPLAIVVLAVAVLGIGATIAGTGWQRLRAHTPARGRPPTGALRLKAAPPGATIPPLWSLAGAAKPRLSIGTAPGCDLRLPAHPDLPAIAAHIDAQRRPGGHAADRLTAHGDAPVSVDGHAVRQPRPLVHGNTIVVGPYRWRYENVLATASPAPPAVPPRRRPAPAAPARPDPPPALRVRPDPPTAHPLGQPRTPA